MKVQGKNINNYGNRLQGGVAAKTLPSFKAAYVPRNYTKIRELSDAIYENSSGKRKMLMDMYVKSGENLNNLVTAVGTAFVAPIFIAFNPVSKEDKNTKAYTSLRQPISAGITLGTQVFVMSNYNKWLDKHAAYLGVDQMDLSAKPPKSTLMPRAEQEYLLYKSDCLKRNIDPEKKKIWINNRVRKLQDEAFYDTLHKLRKTMDITNLDMADVVKPAAVESKRKSMFKDILKDKFSFTESELENIDSLDTLRKKGKSLISSKGLDFDHVRETIDRAATDAAIKELNECIDMEASVKHQVSTHLHDMQDKYNEFRFNAMQRYNINPSSSSEKSGTVINRFENELRQAKIDIYNEKLNSLKAKYDKIASLAEDAKTKDDKIFEYVYNKIKNAKSMERIKDHGQTFESAKRDVIIKKYLTTSINKAEAKLKGWKDRSGIIVGLLILPITCGILNWSYPRIMEKFFPKLSAAKAASKAKLYGLDPNANSDKNVKEAK